MKRRSEEQRNELVARIEKRIAQGERTVAACNAEGVSNKTYYQWKRNGKPPRKYKTRAKTEPQLVHLPIASLPNSLMIVWGTPNDVNQALEKVIRIQNG